MVGNINLVVAFLAGIVSFLSPCCLPLVPSYLAQLVGPGVMEAMLVESDGAAGVRAGASGGVAALEQGGTVALAPALVTTPRRLPLWHALAFVGGFALAFTALGATASVMGGFLVGHRLLLSQLGGMVLIVMGLHFAGLIRIPWLYRDASIRWRPTQRSLPASFVVGLIFALGWTPCLGVIITSILVLAAQSATLGAGVVLLAVYSLGLGLPFIALGAAFSQMRPLLRRLAPHLGTIERVTGIVIALMGVLIFNDWLLYLNRYFTFSIGGL